MKNRLHDISLYLITFLLSACPAMLYMAPAFEDGLGTMATAAYLTGHDWSSFLAEDGYYYKYGQALWYLLPFACIGDAIVRYKVMLLINSVLTSFIPVIAYRISVRFILLEKKQAYLIALVVGWMPSVLLYNKYTWAETNLMVIPWVIMLLECTLYFQEELTSRKRLEYSSLLAFMAVYAFMSHQRGIIVVIATTITVMVVWMCRRGCVSLTAYFGSLAAGLVLDSLLCLWQKAQVYAGAVLKHNTLADFLKPEIYHMLFSRKGMEAMMRTALGWLFHSACSTLGMAIIGLICMLLLIWKALCRRSIHRAEELIALQGALSFLGAFALGLMFFFQSMYHYYDGTEIVRCDHLLFGRYLESTLPILFYMGLAGMALGVQRKVLKWCSAVIHAGLVAFTTVYLLPLMQGVNCYVHSLMALNLCMDTSGVTKTLDVIPNYTFAIMLFGIISVVTGIVLSSLAEKHMRLAVCMMGILFVWIYIWNCVTVIGRVDSAQATVYAQYYLNH